MDNIQGFADLCEKLADFIDENSTVSNTLKFDLVEAQQNLLEAKQYYYQQLILYTELKEILLDNNYGLSDQQYEDTKTDEKNIFKLVSETLCQVDAKNSLNISIKGKPLPEEQLFGLNVDDFELEAKKKKSLHQNIQQHCIPVMEKRLKNKCIELFKFWNPINKDSSEGLALAKANQLAITIGNEKKKLDEARLILKKEERKFDDVYDGFYKNISLALQKLEEKMESYSQKPHLEETKITVDWLSAKCDYILSKIKVMKNHIYEHTYTKETFEALTKVRKYLDQDIVRTHNELHRTKQALYTYESVGDTFKHLLNQYTQLTIEIDNKKWALTELTKSTE